MNDFVPNTKTFKPFSGWNSGYPDHLVFLVRLNQIESDEIIKRINDMQKILACFEAYIPFPDEYYHITVKALGFLDVDHTEDDVELIINKVPDILSRFDSFNISINQIKVFPSVIYAGIDDDGLFRELNKSLLQVSEIKLKYDYPAYIPHMALGTFKENESLDELLSLVEQNKTVSFGKANINHLDLTNVRWHDSKFPEFKLVKRFELND